MRLGIRNSDLVTRAIIILCKQQMVGHANLGVEDMDRETREFLEEI